jgi:hypothetical protein
MSEFNGWNGMDIGVLVAEKRAERQLTQQGCMDLQLNLH